VSSTETGPKLSIYSNPQLEWLGYWYAQVVPLARRAMAACGLVCS
jgi:hypothetical protein